MCKTPYCSLPPTGPGAPLRTEREVRYKTYAPKLYQHKSAGAAGENPS